MIFQSSCRFDRGWGTDVHIERNSTAEVVRCVQASKYRQVSISLRAFSPFLSFRFRSRQSRHTLQIFFRLFSFAWFDLPFCSILLSFRLLDVCHGQLERDRQLVLFLVFEHLEEDLAGYLSRVDAAGLPARTIQVRRISTTNLIIEYS